MARSYRSFLSISSLPVFILLGILLQIAPLNAQVYLDADGPGETYELINSVLAPGYNVIEVPDCAHPDFGRHIEEVYDSVLEKYVFVFHIHVTPDNDRCSKFDRQRNEIKTYDKSPDNLKATAGETVEYKWRFRIDSGFQSSSSFTHLHQLKSVGAVSAEESMPLITFTARKGSPDKLQLRYSRTTSQSTYHQVELTPFKGEWVEVVETVTFGESGRYHMIINRIKDDSTLMTYNNDNIRMWKTDADFIRPKWGIYRSLNSPGDLRDEMVSFSDFVITERPVGISDNQGPMPGPLNIYPNPSQDYIQFKGLSLKTPSRIIISDQAGRTVLEQVYKNGNRLNISSLESGIYLVRILSSDGTIRISKLLKQ